MIFIAIGFATLYLFIFLQLKQTESQLTSYGNVTDSAIGNFLEQLPESQNVKIEKTVEGISFVVKGGEGSSLNADMLDGHDTAYFTNATNLTSGVLPESVYSAWKDFEAEGITSQGKIKAEYLPAQFTGGSESISWNDIKNRPTGLDDGDDVGSSLTEGQIETFITNGALNLSAGTTINSANLATENWVTAQNYLTGVNFSQITNGAGDASITFNSIPFGYNKAVIEFMGRGTDSAGQFLRLQFNGDTGNNYTWAVWNRWGYANSSSTSFIRTANVGGTSYTAGHGNQVKIEITNLQSTTWNKMVTSTENDTLQLTESRHIGYWTTLSPVTSITLSLAAGNLAQGTTVSLYGIK